MTIVVRKEIPPNFNSYKKYKKYLRKDFRYKCAYCFIHEGDNGSFHNFACEHFKPKSLVEFRHLKNNYENLLYACLDCNQLKANIWPSEIMIQNGFFFLNPCEVDYDNHFEVNKHDFKLISKSSAAEYMIEKIHLNRNRLITLRRKYYLQQEVEKEISNLLKILEKLNKEHSYNDKVKKIVETISKKYHELNNLKYTPFSEKDMK